MYHPYKEVVIEHMLFGTQTRLSGPRDKTYVKLLNEGTGLDSVAEMQAATEDREILARSINTYSFAIVCNELCITSQRYVVTASMTSQSVA